MRMTSKDEPVDVSMKPLLGLAIDEAVKLAIIDSMTCNLEATDQQRMEWLWDIYSIPEGEEGLASMDPMALAKNIACRLMGDGGWTVRGVYAGNATPREILESCIERPDQDPLGDIKMDLKLGPEEQ